MSKAKSATMDRPVAQQPVTPDKLNDAHLRRMVDDTGIFQHAKFSLPNPQEGYTTDDNARLMLMAAMYYEATGRQEYLDMCYRALAFLQYAERDGWFRNFCGYDRRFLESAGSQDCYGRCVWCLGYITSRKALPKGLRRAADALLKATADSAEKLTFLRSCAYTAMGLALWGNHCRDKLAEHLARVAAHYHTNADGDWFWYEGEMTYCNAAIPHSLLLGYKVIGGDRLLQAGLESLDFLLNATMRDGFFWPIGCHGWGRRGQEQALYDQQPVEACGTLLCCLSAHEVTGEKLYLDKARLCLDWFLGSNSLGVGMIDLESGGCYDGLQEHGPNLNQGAESLLSWYVSVLAMDAHTRRAGEEKKRYEI